MKVFIVTPVYFDVDNFLILHDEIKKNSGNSDLKFIVIDDTAGADESITKLQNSADIKIITPVFNLGHQRAIVFGLRKLALELNDEDIVITMDSDGEDKPDDIPLLIAEANKHHDQRLHVVLAKRTKRKETISFKLMYLAHKFIFKLLTGKHIKTGNFACYRASVVRKILPHPYFDLCYSSSFKALQIMIHEVPCARGSRYSGQSKMGTLALVMHGLRMLMPFIDVISTRLLITFIAVFFLSSVLIISIVFLRFFSDISIPSWLTFASLFFLMMSLISASSLGVMFAVFTQVKSMSLKDLEGTRK